MQEIILVKLLPASWTSVFFRPTLRFATRTSMLSSYCFSFLFHDLIYKQNKSYLYATLLQRNASYALWTTKNDVTVNFFHHVDLVHPIMKFSATIPFFLGALPT